MKKLLQEGVTSKKANPPKNQKPSEELLTLIEMYNLTKNHPLLPDYFSLQEEELAKTENINISEDEKNQLDLAVIRRIVSIVDNIKDLPKFFQDEIWNSPDVEEEIKLDFFIRKYNWFLFNKKTLSSIMSRIERLRRYNTNYKESLILSRNSGFVPIVLRPNKAIEPDISALDMWRIENERRLKFCESCKNLFWAYRLDANTCSTKCANTRRQRKYRQKSKSSE